MRPLKPQETLDLKAFRAKLERHVCVYPPSEIEALLDYAEQLGREVGVLGKRAEGLCRMLDEARAKALREAGAIAERHRQHWLDVIETDVLDGDKWQHRVMASVARDIAADLDGLAAMHHSVLGRMCTYDGVVCTCQSCAGYCDI